MPVAPPRYVTFDEFMEWADEDTRAEWVDGEVVFMTAVNIGHDRTGGFLRRLFEEFLEVHPVGEVFGEGYVMRNRKRPSGRLPDLQYVSNERAHRLTRTFLDGPPDIAVEIISPDSRLRDTVDKLREYEEFGVPEYWILDEENLEARFFQHGNDGRYAEVFADTEGVYRSKMLPGFWFKVEWLWPGYQPTMRQVRKEWGID